MLLRDDRSLESAEFLGDIIAGARCMFDTANVNTQ